MEERNFKGIWIPKEIWITDELSLQEKVVLVEIDSLDDEETGCYASNKYFAEFFKLTNGRVSQIIKQLQEKGYLDITYKYKGKEITERLIRVKRPPYPQVFNKLNTYLENDDRGIKYSKQGYLENAKENNISINNINNNNNKKKYIKKDSSKEFEDEFEEIWKLYPKKVGKKDSLRHYIRNRKNGTTRETIENGLKNYIDYIASQNIPTQYIKDGSTWFNQESWNDERVIVHKETEEEWEERMEREIKERESKRY